VAPDRWVLKGALALDFRFHSMTRPTRDMDLGRADDEDAAIEDLTAVQQLVLDDFFTFATRRTDALDEAGDFRAIRFHQVQLHAQGRRKHHERSYTVPVSPGGDATAGVKMGRGCS